MNLVFDKWLPVVRRTGEFDTVSLLDFFQEISDISDIAGSSLTIDSALRRFVLAVFVRIYSGQLQRGDTWEECFETQSIAAEAAQEYLNTWSHRFELFDKKRPFYQDINVQNVKKHSLNKLDFDAAAGNNAVWNSHRFEADGRTASPAAAACLLISAQAFAVGGGYSTPFNFCHGVLISGGIVFWLEPPTEGTSFLRALLLNAPVNLLEKWTRNSGDFDTPEWENDQPVQAVIRTPKGVLDLLTFQSRRFLLQLNSDGLVDGVQLSQGDKPNILNWGACGESMMAFERYDDSYRTLGLRRKKALWREFPVLYEALGDDSLAPESFKNVKAWLTSEEIHWIPIRAFAVETDKGKILHSHSERLPLYPDISNSSAKRARLKGMFEGAKSVQDNLKKAIWVYAKECLFPRDSHLSNVQRDEAGKLANSIEADQLYWATLGNEIDSTLKQLSEAESTEDRDVVEVVWRRICRDTAQNALTVTLDSRGFTVSDSRARALSIASLRRSTSV